MKKLLILSVIWAFTCPLSPLEAQDTLLYKPLASFEGDTVAYLEYNFTTRSKQYAGKKVSDILKDLELPVIHSECMVRFKMIEPGAKISQIFLYVIMPVNERPHPIRDYYVTLVFKNPPPVVPFRGSSETLEAIKDLEISFVGTIIDKEVNSRYLEYAKRKQKQ
jgi:hypothetical protein